MENSERSPGKGEVDQRPPVPAVCRVEVYDEEGKLAITIAAADMA
jgi:hypothetical protein